MIELLLRYGADPLAPADDGETPLSYDQMAGLQNIAQRLQQNQ